MTCSCTSDRKPCYDSQKFGPCYICGLVKDTDNPALPLPIYGKSLDSSSRGIRIHPVAFSVQKLGTSLGLSNAEVPSLLKLSKAENGKFALQVAEIMQCYKWLVFAHQEENAVWRPGLNAGESGVCVCSVTVCISEKKLMQMFQFGDLRKYSLLPVFERLIPIFQEVWKLGFYYGHLA